MSSLLPISLCLAMSNAATDTLAPLSYDTQLGSTILPRRDDAFAVAIDDTAGNNQTSIILLGGFLNDRQLLTFDPITSAFGDLGSEYSDIPIQGTTQFFTQPDDDSLFMIDEIGTSLYKLQIDTLDVQTTNITLPQPVGVQVGTMLRQKACLAHYNSLLFV